ncbi:DEAD/DEAH box helicase [Aquibium sp. ELW1220]|uniref:DEAD/DEAH box helicase n=1 Tax=Aquibium sp. ELW1220 TaxID=2976766 RepID=UPI0025B1923C|nr:DEAD/DEAH box helicase [Aquibium sp. ELW1220]MDN2583723.1 DEAD/DEAH box helicase [Aquibium sp. ELW1220]
MTIFEGVVPALATALQERGYTTLTPVQEAMLAPGLRDADALVSARTGSGKTVAFGLALAPTLLGDDERFGHAAAPYALVIAPTRELALQVKRELEWLYAGAGAQIASCVGGMDIRTERRALERGAHIVVGTPGRLRDHITRYALDMSALRAVVLDEADEMLDLGFREDLEFILEAAPAERRTLMFSATVSKPIATLAENYQRNAVRVATETGREQHADIEYRVHPVAASDRDNAIVNVLRFHEARNAIVFCNTRAAVNHLTARLNNRGFSVVALSGELSQSERTHALQAMRDGRARVCIATDVAARGIDLPNLDLVVHADLPTNPEALLHRSGRTGRAGRKGISALIVPMPARRRIERTLQLANITAVWAAAPNADDVAARDEERLLSDAALTETVTEEEGSTVEKLLARHAPEQVAAAFLRLWRAGRSAPEELVDVPVDPNARPRRDRDERAPLDGPRPRDRDIGATVWFSLSVGRKQNAEPRWLIPMLCRSDAITKSEIGAIKMQPEETFVEIAASHADALVAAIGSKGTLQNNIRVTRLSGTPDMSPRKAWSGEPRTERPRKSFDDRPRKEHGGWQDKPARDARPERPATRDEAPARPDWKKRADRPAWNERPEKPVKPEGSWARRDAAPADRAPAERATAERAGDDRAPFRKGPKKPSKDKGKPDFAGKAEKKAKRKNTEG